MGDIVIEIPGNPVPKGRPRFTKSGRTYTPAKTKAWELEAQHYARTAIRHPVSCPLLVSVVAVFPIPASWPLWKQQAALDGTLHHTAKPDGDNVLKAVGDALNGIVWADDAQITRMSIEKRYGEITGVWVNVSLVRGLCSQERYKPTSDY